MKLSRRCMLQISAAAAAVPALSSVAGAQSFPNRPLRIVVGFAPGGGQDQLARLIGQGLSERIGQQVLVENRPGSGNIPATEAVIGAQPDGHTLLLVSSPAVVNPALQPKMKYEFLRDIAPVWGVIRETSVLAVHPAFPAKTIPELIAYARDNPGKINMASSGIAATAHMAGELFKLAAGVDMLHVPYRGTAPALIDLLAGRADVMFSSLTGAIAYIKQDRLRVLGVTTARRATALPDVPAIGEVVAGYEASGLTGFGAPRDTPREIVDALNAHIAAVVMQPALQARFKDLGSTEVLQSPAEFAAFLAGETEKWRKVIETAGIKPQ